MSRSLLGQLYGPKPKMWRCHIPYKVDFMAQNVTTWQCHIPYWVNFMAQNKHFPVSECEVKSESTMMSGRWLTPSTFLVTIWSRILFFSYLWRRESNDCRHHWHCMRTQVRLCTWPLISEFFSKTSSPRISTRCSASEWSAWNVWDSMECSSGSASTRCVHAHYIFCTYTIFSWYIGLIAQAGNDNGKYFERRARKAGPVFHNTRQVKGELDR